ELRIVGTEDVRWLVREAGPAFLRQLAGRNGDGRPRDDSRSAVAFRKGLELVRVGAGYDQMCEALRANPETALAGMRATAPAGWAALSTSGLVALRLPPIVCTIVILADNDTVPVSGPRALRRSAGTPRAGGYGSHCRRSRARTWLTCSLGAPMPASSRC